MRRIITTGVSHNSFVEVLRGLAAGEQVIIDGQVRVAPGVKVAIVSQSGDGAAR